MAYSQFHDTFWTDPDIRKLSPDEKLVFIWFITNPSRHYSGIYFFEPETIPKQTGLSEKTVSKSINTLSIGYSLIKYDAKFSMVWVRKMARYEIPKSEKTGNYSEKQLIGVANHFKNLHNCPLIRDWMTFYPDLQIPYQYPIRQEEEEEEEKEKIKEEEKEYIPCQPMADRTNSFGIQSLANLWNELAPHPLSRVNLPLTRKPKEMQTIATAIKRQPDKNWWESVLCKLGESPFLLGDNDRGWKANFDFVVNKAEVILDGKYSGMGFATGKMQSQSRARAAGPLAWLEGRRGKDETRK